MKIKFLFIAVLFFVVLNSCTADPIDDSKVKDSQAGDVRISARSVTK